MDVKEKILDAIQLLASNSVEKAGYDKTIQAQIISCEDATIGKYRCRYQDSVFYAYSNNSNTTFSNNSYVYILVPGNDFKKEKTILGTTQKLGINYISQAEGEQAYDITGTNCIESDDTYYLNTNNKNYQYTIYEHGKTISNAPNLNVKALEQYIRESSSLIAGATFKTTIPAARQSRGHYGIIYNLRFRENGSDQYVVRPYIINEDNMVDNPYRLLYPTRQYQIFDIDGTNFDRVESIIIFNNDFPGATGNTTTGRLSSGDIQITKLEIAGAVRMSDEEVNGIAISFFTPQGTFFTEQSTAQSHKTITAQVKVKGKLVSAAQRIPFYWGKENVSITPSSEYYNKQLGRGWKCLNEHNVVSSGDNMTNPTVEWVPGSDTYIIYLPEATARDNRFKVAIIYDNTVITKQINIQNLAATAPKLTIESSTGTTQFYYDTGHPTLTCKVNDGEILSYTYYWAYESDAGILTDLPETTAQNTQYTNAVTALQNLRTAISNGTKFAKTEEANLTNLEAQVEAFKFTQRVQKNKVYDVQIKNITNKGIFKCSVYNGQTYLGTAAITLTNSLNGENLYSLVINNGSATFQYNENGIAPNNKSMDVPQEIQALSFTVYDNLGQPIDSQSIIKARDCQVKWYFPIKDSLLQSKKLNEDTGEEERLNEGYVKDNVEGYAEYENNLLLVYNIAQKYDIKKKRNQIKLNVNYKGMNLTAETDFSFVKQGEPGTNGTEFIVKLVPNTRMDDPPLWPIVTKAGSKYFLNYGINTQATQQEIGVGAGNNYQFFKAQLWHNGEKVWEGFKAADSALDGVTKPTAVHWEVLQNKYNSNKSDDSAFGVSTPTSGYIYYTGDHLQNNLTTPLANIIKCSITWEDKLYYGTIPITTAWTSNEKYRVSLRDYTGFRYVIYTSDGMTPQYDNSHPFEFVCEEKINNVWEDISLVSGSHAVTYAPGSCGNIVTSISGNTINYSNQSLLQLLSQNWYREGLEKNQWNYRPASRYDGQCVNVAVLCEYKQGSSTIGKINIPIHFLLNKYGLANINEWDGNSVQVNEEGGYILAPQMGAGSKDSNNNFTGVLMGQVKVAGKNKPDTGLLGYSSGDRTFFVNSDNGSAIFGKAGNGQIIIDPDGNKALLYSSAFWKNYDPNTGLPQSYGSGNENKQGLLIDLTTPQIRFGNDNFSVDENGYLIARGGGSIAGWLIGDTTLKSAAKNLTLDSSSIGSIYSLNHSALTNTGEGFYISAQGLSIGRQFKVTSNGIVTVGNGAVNNSSLKHWTINTTGSGTTDNSYISYNTTVFGGTEGVTNPASSVYIGTDGISLGRYFFVDSEGNVGITRGSIRMGTTNVSTQKTGRVYDANTHATTEQLIFIGDSSNYQWIENGRYLTFENTGVPYTEMVERPMFYVNTRTSEMEIHVRNGTIDLGKFTVNNKGYMTATSGKIGNFYIGDKYLANPSTITTFTEADASSNSYASVYLGTDGISLGKNFSVSNIGIMKIRRGSIQLGVSEVNNVTTWNFSVDDNGNLSAKKGKIGGITIDANHIEGGQLASGDGGFALYSDGVIKWGPSGNRTQTIGGPSRGSNQAGDIIGWNEGLAKMRIQPGYGMAKFQNIDITNTISFGGTLQGFTSLSFGAYGDTKYGNTKPTFQINATTGDAIFNDVVINGEITVNGSSGLVAVFG